MHAAAHHFQTRLTWAARDPSCWLLLFFLTICAALPPDIAEVAAFSDTMLFFCSLSAAAFIRGDAESGRHADRTRAALPTLPVSHRTRVVAEALAATLLFLAACALLGAGLDVARARLPEGVLLHIATLFSPRPAALHVVAAGALVGAFMPARGFWRPILGIAGVGLLSIPLYLLAPPLAASGLLGLGALLWGRRSVDPGARMLRAALRPALPDREAAGRSALARATKPIRMVRAARPAASQLTRDGAGGLARAAVGASALGAIFVVWMLAMTVFIKGAPTGGGLAADLAFLGQLLLEAPEVLVFAAPLIPLLAFVAPMGALIESQPGAAPSWRAWLHLPLPRSTLFRAFGAYGAGACLLAAALTLLLGAVSPEDTTQLAGLLVSVAPAAGLIYPILLVERGGQAVGGLGAMGVCAMAVGAPIAVDHAVAGWSIFGAGFALLYGAAALSALRIRAELTQPAGA